MGYKRNKNKAVGGNKNPEKTITEVASGSSRASQDSSHSCNNSRARDKKKKGSANQKPTVAAGSMPGSQDSGHNRNDAAAEAPTDDAHDIKETKKPHPAGVQLGQSSVQESPVFKKTGTKDSHPAGHEPLQSAFSKPPEREKTGVSSNSDCLADDNVHKETKSISADCVICHEVRLIKNMQRSFMCRHYFCKECIKSYVNAVVKDETKQVIPADVRCPETKYCTESLPVKIVLDNLDRDVKYVWLAVHTFWSEEDRVAAGESSVLKFHDSKQKGITLFVHQLQYPAVEFRFMALSICY
ncbi:OLC1v1017867C2 [Oldenlandia corymbosa var. corymbosa]|uniref:OLC1v1017867C2 n=1 Tax=Oldenlandia corymbosa var. corymbosa TaxID=529605 RepID=A0AAV1EAF3_OLDCO|nr:OLC1v1017867C2 [Oldenlandia corymbosa var. corymbosa]